MTARARIIPIFVPHLGCPNDCVFCNQRRISGAQAPASAMSVRAELTAALGRLSAGESAQLAFYGGSFTAIPAAEQEELLLAAQPFIGRLSGIRLSTRPDAISGEILDRLERFGVDTIELGAQSMRDKVLTQSRRGHTADDVRKAAVMIKERGFKLILQMMTGLPGDDPEGAVYTARELRKLAPDGVRIYPTVIVRDTELYELWKKGEYREHSVEDAVSVCAELLPIFEGIPIIRLGLNPTDDLSGGDAVGGAYHPALGELVYSRVMREKIAALLVDLPEGSDVEIGVHACRVSQAVGQRRQNIEQLTRRFALRSLRVREIDCGTDVIRVLSVAK